MTGLNKVQIIGHLGRDPETRTFQSGGKVVNLRIATSETWKDRETGERKERTEWHSVAIFNEGLAKVAEQYLRKGSQVYVEGQLETRKWQDQSGQDRYTTEVVLRPYRGEIVLLDGKRDDPHQSAGAGREAGSDGFRGSGQREAASGAVARGNGPGRGPDMDDEIPFNMEWRG
jgi:single-strand DNA-binding protein